ncbi:MAG TPA: zinc ribbon domain-containing protein [Pyrinomonadaceae bacterium]|nr:zinc ribbon domain-containing protein [Pyrinomonadaceae bacterium]
MALIICPECGKEVSASAVACPNCGHPFATLDPPTVVRETVPPPVIERETFPKWVLIPIVVIGVLLLFTLVALYRNQEPDERNINVDLSAQKRAANTKTVNTRIDDEPSQVIVPSAPETTTAPPQTIPPQSQTEVTRTEIPDSTDRGTLSLEVKITNPNGGTRPVTDEKFYLLDKDLESILNEANLQPISGQSMVNSFGLSVLYPDRYNDFRTKALSAINNHIEHSLTTDSSGKAQIKGIQPDSYYLFGITTSSNSFSVWNSPVTIRPGENPLILPARAMTQARQ